MLQWVAPVRWVPAGAGSYQPHFRSVSGISVVCSSWFSIPSAKRLMSLKGVMAVSESASQKSWFFNQMPDFRPQLWGCRTPLHLAERGRNDTLVCLSHPEWDVSIQSYVLRTNYEEYAVILMKKKSSFGPSTTLKLYGMSGHGT